MTEQYQQRCINRACEGEGGAGSILNREDQSINGASAPGVYTSQQFFLQTSTQINPAGAYNGGGTGNKSVAAFKGFDGVRLDTLTEPLDYTRRNMSPTSGSPWTSFVNIIVEFEPAINPGLFKILSLNTADPIAPAGSGAPAGNPGIFTVTTPEPDVERRVWDPSTNIVEVVTGLAGLSVVPAPDYVAPSVPAWQGEGFLMSTLLANYPDAVIRNADTGDGGLMLSPLISGGLMLVEGDSGMGVFSLIKIEALSFNGVTLAE